MEDDSRPALHVPPELWSLVAQYLERHELHELSTLNHVFYRTAMDHLYGEFELTGPRNFLKGVECLLFPHLAERVQALTVEPHVTWHAINHGKPKLFPLFKGSQRGSKLGTVTGPPSPSLLCTKSSAERYLAVTEMSRKLVNVKHLTISWGAQENWAKVDPWCPILKALIPVISCNLLSLSLTVPFFVLGESALPSSALPRLQELNIKFSSNPRTVSSQRGLISLINPLPLTLTSLSVTCSDQHLSWSTFFDDLYSSPHLTELYLSIPFDYRHFPRPSRINRLIVGYSSLQKLTIIMKKCRCPFNRRLQPDKVSAWWKQCFEGLAITEIKLLQLGLGYQPYCVELLQCLQPLPPKLTSVEIFQTELKHAHVVTVLNTFGGPMLKFLSMGVKEITPQLFELFALVCPNLVELRLEAPDLAITRAALGDYVPCLPNEFLKAMEDRRMFHQVAVRYDSWKLDSLHLWIGNSPNVLLRQPLLGLIKGYDVPRIQS